MGNYRTIDDIIAEKRDYIKDYQAKIMAWTAVTIKTKKDGNEFKTLSNRCVDGARIRDKGFMSGEELMVYYTGRRTYMDDSIDCFGYCDELPDGDERKIPNAGGLRARYNLSPAEMREAIEARIKRYKECKAQQEKSLEWLENNASAIETKMGDFIIDLFAGAPDDIGIRHAFGDIMDYGIKYGIGSIKYGISRR